MVWPHVHVPFHRINEYLPFIKKNRLNLEIYFNAETLDSLNPAEIETFQNSLDYGPSLSFHAPFMDLCPGAVDPKVRAATLDRFNRVLEIAGVLLPKAIVFHSGYEKWKYALHIDLWLEKSLLTWEPLIKKASEIRTKIAIENIFEDSPVNLIALMQKIQSEYFGICFDTGHFNLFSKTILEDWIEGLGPYIAELHLHDNDKTSDQHLPVGEGEFNFEKLFSLFSNRECIYTVEAHTPDNVIRSISALHTHLKETVDPVSERKTL